MTTIFLNGARRRAVLAILTILGLFALVFVAPQSAEAATGIGGVQLLDAANKPVVGARVSVTSTTQSYTYDFATDAKGVATFTANPAFAGRSFTVYIAPKAGSGLLPGYWDGRPSGQTVPQTITPGQPNLKVVAKAGTAASIAGTVSGSGSPAALLSGVKVTALTTSGREAGSATTGTSGAYSIAGLAADSYTLRFDNTNPLYALTTWWKNKATQQLSDVFVVAAGQALSGQSIVLDTVTAITGSVKGRATTPVALASVNVTAYTSTGGYAGSTSTDTAGRYSLVLTTGGSFILSFNNYQNAAYLTTTWWKNKPTQETADRITVATGQSATGRDIVIDRVASISGTVTGSAATPGSPSTPISGASITAYTPAGRYSGYGYSDANGNYTVTGLAAGSYSLSISNPGNPAFVRNVWYNNKPSGSVADTLTVVAGQSLGGTNIVLPPGTTISGSVRGTGTPYVALAGVNVAAYAGDDTMAAATATTDSSGAYTLTGLAAGPYRLQYYNNDHPAWVSNVWWNSEATRGSATVIQLVAGKPVTNRNIVIARGAAVSGTVRGAGTPAAPLAGVNVVAHTADGVAVKNVFTDASGTYSLTGLAAGTYTLEFANYGDPSFEFSTWWKNKPAQAVADPVTLTAGTTLAGSDITLSKAATITGTVTDASGHPLAGVTVPVWQLVGGSYTRAADSYAQTTDDSGVYTLPGLSPGSYKVGFTDSPAGNSYTGTGGTTYQDEFWNDASTLAAATPIVLAAGQAATSNAVLADKLLTFARTALPTVAGTAKVAEKLKATPGTWVPAPTYFAYQWKVGGVVVAGATSSTYTVRSGDVGKTLTASVTGTRPGYETVVMTSAATAVVVP